MKRKKRFLGLFVIWFTFVLLLTLVFFVGRNINYSAKGKQIDIISESAFERNRVIPEESMTLVLYENTKDGRSAKKEISATLKQMKIPFRKKKLSGFHPSMLEEADKVILLTTEQESIQGILPDLTAWVREGNSLMIGLPFELDELKRAPEDESEIEQENAAAELKDLMGIRKVSRQKWATVKGFTCLDEFMPGGSRELTISTPYESSLDVRIRKDCEVFMTTTDEERVPLIWKNDYGRGEVVVDNLGFMEKAYRGFHCAAYTLMGDYCLWPVINGSVFYIDDFPSPVPPGDSYQIREDYNMDIKDFYTQIWWKDVSNLSQKYNFPYTGLVIEMYSNQTAGKLPRQEDTTRFEYYGNMLLGMGGELGIHGYNHMPLVLENFDYLNKYESYHQWISKEEMRASIEELLYFCHDLYPMEKFQVYVPPSNIISKEGREILAEDFPEVKCIASLYLPDQNDVSYATDFEVTEDGLIQTPRITSGYVLEDYMRTAALSELYLHCVNTHFQHPDDVLDVDRGANLGWQELYDRFEDYVDWLYGAMPNLRSLTGSELAGAVQRYDHVEVNRKESARGMQVDLGGFADEAWFYLKSNKGRPKVEKGGTISKVADDLYLINATSPELEITVAE